MSNLRGLLLVDAELPNLLKEIRVLLVACDTASRKLPATFLDASQVHLFGIAVMRRTSVAQAVWRRSQLLQLQSTYGFCKDMLVPSHVEIKETVCDSFSSHQS